MFVTCTRDQETFFFFFFLLLHRRDHERVGSQMVAPHGSSVGTGPPFSVESSAWCGAWPSGGEKGAMVYRPRSRKNGLGRADEISVFNTKSCVSFVQINYKKLPDWQCRNSKYRGHCRYCRHNAPTSSKCFLLQASASERDVHRRYHVERPAQSTQHEKKCLGRDQRCQALNAPVESARGCC